MNTSPNNTGQALLYRQDYSGMPVIERGDYVRDSVLSNISQIFTDFEGTKLENVATSRSGLLSLDYSSVSPTKPSIQNIKNVRAAHNYEKSVVLSNSVQTAWSDDADRSNSTFNSEFSAKIAEYRDFFMPFSELHTMDGSKELVENERDTLDQKHIIPAERFNECRKRTGLNNVFYGPVKRNSLATTTVS